jgi:hypothetical protein
MTDSDFLTVLQHEMKMKNYNSGDTMKKSGLNVDLHVHSKSSKRPSQWILQKLDCPESFTDPVKLYEIEPACGNFLFAAQRV